MDIIDQQKLIDANTKAQKELDLESRTARKEEKELDFKRDCRRTALQLAERCSKNKEGDKVSDPIELTANSEILYRWLIADSELQKNWVDIFMKRGVLVTEHIK